MYAAFKTILTLAYIALAHANPARRDGCGSLSGTDNVSNFKLAAVHEAGDTITVSMLALILETPLLYNSWIAVSELQTTFSMTDGAITSDTGAVSLPVDTAVPLEFVSNVNIPPYPAYCAVTDGSIPLQGGQIFSDEIISNFKFNLLGVLAVNGDAKSFALCMANEIGHPKIVVYDPQEGADLFEFSSCSSVDVVLLGATFSDFFPHH